MPKGKERGMQEALMTYFNGEKNSGLLLIGIGGVDSSWVSRFGQSFCKMPSAPYA